ncbi:MAG TPA: MFS transporter [Ensifer sp.]|jgi:EmrB/QacA subfamily drug resistance transporter|uniref:MFS transporter n=1 Tax=Ensifer sp. TaxID=1872086 RepID=UPI002E12DCF6|nr:MFS transporter [Ensifer sp.]
MNSADTTLAPASSAPPIRFVLISLSLSMLLSSLGTSSANVALPALADAFGVSFQAVQWVVLAYLLAVTTLIVSVGRLGDIFGRRRLLLGGIVLFTAASVVAGLTPGFAWLIAARAVQGLGAAMMMALTMAFVGETVPKERTGSAMGLLGTMSAIGTALGPSLGGALVAGPGWRAIFLVNVPLGLVAFFLARRHLPADGKAGGRGRARFDVPGTLLLALSLGAYALAMTAGHGRFGIANVGLLAAAAFGVGLFLLVETRVASPLIRLSMFRDLVLSAGLSTNALVSTVMMATLVVGPFYLSRGAGLDAAMVGLVMSIGPVISAFGGVVAGWIVDRLGAPSVVAVGLVAMVAGCFALALLPGIAGVVGYIVAIAMLTPGYQLFQAANNTAVMADVAADRRGVVSGLLNLSRNLGLVTGASVMGAVFAFAVAAPDIAGATPQAVTSGMQATFVVAGLLTLLALGVAAGSRVLGRARVRLRNAP